MKSILSLSFVALLTVLMSSGAMAAKKKTQAPDTNATDQNYTVPIQQETARIDASDLTYQPIVVDYEFTSSTWSPNAFSRPSLIPADANFSSGAIPMIGINRIAPWKAAWGGVLETDAGFQYAQLARQGLVTSGSNSVTTEEDMNLLALKLGASYRAPSLGTRFLQPSLELDAMPTWLSSAASAFEQYGTNAVGVMFAADLKLMYCPDFMQKASVGGRTGEGVGVAYLMTFGNVGGSDLGGSGMQAILRMGF